MTDRLGIRRAVEAMLFLADEPLSASVLAQALEVDRRSIEECLEELARSYEEREAGLVLRVVGGGWRLSTHPAVAPVMEQFVLATRRARLTRAALETLAIVAYKQPVTRHQLAAIRGVDSDGVLRSLVARGLVAEVGRDDTPGRPMLYGTTPLFLERLGLESVSELPSLAPFLEGAAAGGDPAAGG
jgi:segregation and condensation protein B